MLRIIYNASCQQKQGTDPAERHFIDKIHYFVTLEKGKDTAMDLRTQKIYDALTKAFTELLLEKGFEAITVGELCQRAQTRRATFYRHFSDKYDFFQYVLKQHRAQMVQSVMNAVSEDDPKVLLHQVIDTGLEYIDKHKDFLQAVAGSDVANAMLQTMSDEIYDDRTFSFLPNDEIAVQFLIGGLNKCTRWWFSHRNKLSRKDMQERLYVIANAFVDAINEK